MASSAPHAVSAAISSNGNAARPKGRSARRRISVVTLEMRVDTQAAGFITTRMTL